MGVATRADVRAHNLRHRSVYVVVRSSAGDVLVHRRADWKDVFPGRWDIAFGGVADVGEAPGDAARRELLEEAGVEGSLRRIGVGSYADDSIDVEGHLFEVTSEGPFVFTDGEVAAVRWVPAGDLSAWLATVEACPDSVTLLLGQDHPR